MSMSKLIVVIDAAGSSATYKDGDLYCRDTCIDMITLHHLFGSGPFHLEIININSSVDVWPNKLSVIAAVGWRFPVPTKGSAGYIYYRDTDEQEWLGPTKLLGFCGDWFLVYDTELGCPIGYKEAVFADPIDVHKKPS